MNVSYRPSFRRSIKKIIDPALKEQVVQVVLSVKKAQTTSDIPELKKLKGYKKGIFYRITVGDHRIGVTIEDNMVTFFAFMHRKDIYKFFP